MSVQSSDVVRCSWNWATSIIFIFFCLFYFPHYFSPPRFGLNHKNKNMAGINSKTSRILTGAPTPFCTRAHQIGALTLVFTTFFFTRLFDQTFSPSPLSSHAHYTSLSELDSSAVSVGSDGSLRWPERGYGARLWIKIYVYDENEIDGIKRLLYGRDGNISAQACVKGQWGTQVCLKCMPNWGLFRVHKS